MVPVASKLTFVVLAALLAWESPRPPDFWSGVGHPETRAFYAAMREAMTALDASDEARATTAARRAVELMPDRFEGHLLLALALEEAGNEEAARTFTRARALDARWTSHPIAADYASSAYVRVGDFASAAELACAAARSSEPSQERIARFVRCGASLMATGPEGLAGARRALELGEPERPSAEYLLLLALVYDRSGEHDHALTMLRPIGQRAMDEHVATFLVGTASDKLAAKALLAEALNRIRDAITAYEAAAGEGPWSAHARDAATRLRTRVVPQTPQPPPRSR